MAFLLQTPNPYLVESGDGSRFSSIGLSRLFQLGYSEHFEFIKQLQKEAQILWF